MKMFAILLSVFALLCCAGTVFTLKGEQHLLNSMQSVRHGLTKSEVLEIMGDQMSVVQAKDAPRWISDVASEHESGEFWYYFMGFPPQNMIIYFDAKGHVVYTTWAPT